MKVNFPFRLDFFNNYDVVQGFEKASATCSTGILELKGMPDNMVETTPLYTKSFPKQFFLATWQHGNVKTSTGK